MRRGCWGAQVNTLVLEPLASKRGVPYCSKRRSNRRLVIADIGGGTTDVAIFVDGSVLHTAVLPVGGYHLTHDLVVGLRVPFAAAEAAKLRATATPFRAQRAALEETIELDAFGGEGTMVVHRRRLCEILQARSEEILEMIFREVRQAGYDEMISAGLVLTGGSANLCRLRRTGARGALYMPVRIGYPGRRLREGLVENYFEPGVRDRCGSATLGHARR